MIIKTSSFQGLLTDTINMIISEKSKKKKKNTKTKSGESAPNTTKICLKNTPL